MGEEVMECDILCAGGGIAGLMAAIRARELGASVIVAEKGNVKYSGCGRCGNDHFETYIPEVHGTDRNTFFEELLRTARGRSSRRKNRNIRHFPIPAVVIQPIAHYKRIWN
jgi:flavin-dependent dehydrogenase